jgi:hypothetical protein
MNAKTAILIGGALGLIGIFIYTRPRVTTPTTQPAPTVPVEVRTAPRLPARQIAAPSQPADLAPEVLRSTNLIARLYNEEEAPKLTPEQIESYLAANRRSVESLLGAFRVSGDKAFLKEAQEKFPNDPRVAYAAVFKSDSPEERRQWLDSFKQSAPENSMPAYLSALDYFKAGQSDQALQELTAAAGRPSFQDYSLDFMQSAEEAYRSAGYSDAEAKAIASTQLLLPQLGELRDLGRKLAELGTSYRQAGDQESAQAALQMAMELGQRLERPTGWNTVIGELVGWAVQRTALSAMDPSAPYGTSGQSVQARLDELAQQRASIKAFVQQNSGLIESMSEQDLSTFFDRQKLFGEMEAMKWAQNRVAQR